jgi:hypothetical protein
VKAALRHREPKVALANVPSFPELHLTWLDIRPLLVGLRVPVLADARDTNAVKLVPLTLDKLHRLDRGKAMRCMDCGAGMRLVAAVADHTATVPGFEYHTFECCSCRAIERRMQFIQAGKSPTGRIVQIDRDAHESTYSAKDTRSGLIVLRNQDRKRLWELCNWMGWRVSEDPSPALARD